MSTFSARTAPWSATDPPRRTSAPPIQVGSGGTADQRDALAFIKNVLGEFGLEDLASWAWDQIINGVGSEELLINLRETSQYQARFPAMRERATKGLPGISERDYIDYETNVRQMMMEAGLPPGFYDQASDFKDFLVKDVSIREVQERIVEGYRRVGEAPAEVRAAFGTYFGPASDAALAAFFLDPDRALPLLEDQVRTAEAGGYGQRFGFALDEEWASRLGRERLSADQLQAGFGQARTMGYFADRLGQDRNTAVDATFGMDPVTAERLGDEQQRLAAEGSKGSSRASVGNEGVLGGSYRA